MSKDTVQEKSQKIDKVEQLDDLDQQLTDTTVISDDVIAVIAYMAVKEVPGVFAMGGGLVGDIVEKFGKKSLDKGIKVITKGENVVIDICIFVEYGVKIPEMSIQIQNRVRKAVEDMAGKKVVAINLIIQGVKIQSSDGKEQYPEMH